MTLMIGMRDFKHWQKASNQSIITKLTKQHIAIAVMVIIIIIIIAAD